MTPARQAAAARKGAGLFRLADRGLVVVTGGDRVRWLDGMVSGDVAGLAEGPERSGCYALLLTRQGRIVSDLHVLLRGEALWLEMAAAAEEPVVAHLERFIVADDVTLERRGGEVTRLALEGPAAPAILAATWGRARLPAPDACAEWQLHGAPVLVAAWGFSGLPAFQLLVSPEAAPATARSLMEAGSPLGLLEADPEALEVLRIESGIPALGFELTPDVLPAEARLERAISSDKGCYTGQEVVERMRSRGRVGHLLVGLVCPGAPPSRGAPILVEGRRVGEVTSACRSDSAGSIALGFTRRAHADPGTELSVAGERARVVELPFVPVAPGPPGP